MSTDDPEMQIMVEKLKALAAPTMGENYSRFFDGAAAAFLDENIVILDVEHLPLESRGILIEWIRCQANRAEAKAKLEALMPHILFDIEVAERDALPPGAA